MYAEEESGMSNHTREDLRIRRTRESIQRAFREMLEEMELEQITVKELTQRANINRRTFYLHYLSVEDLLEEVIDAITEDYVRRTNALQARDMPTIAREFLMFFAQQEPLREKIVCSASMRVVSDRLNHKIAVRNQHHVSALDGVDTDTQNLIITFLNSSALGIYRRWVADGKCIPLEQMVDLTVNLICYGFMSLPDYLKAKQPRPKGE